MTHMTPGAIQMRVSEGVSGLSLHELQPAIKKRVKWKNGTPEWTAGSGVEVQDEIPPLVYLF